MDDPFAHLLELKVREGRLLLYHATLADRAQVILASGFRDSAGTYGIGIELRGVFLANRPLDVNEGAKGNTLLEVLLDATEGEIDGFEIKDDPDDPIATHREWCIPAELLNLKGRVRLVPADEAEVFDG